MTAQTAIAAETLIGALAKALPELESAKKNKPNPAFKSKYADLAAMITALEPLREHGLWYRQHSHESEAGVMIETFYIHENGEQLSAGTIYMPATKKDAQGFGSALTYARRYALQTAFGLAVEDDDGNAASRVSGRDKAESQMGPPGNLRDQLEQSVAQEVHHDDTAGTTKRMNWGGRYPNKTSLHKALIVHHAELERLGIEGALDDLDGYLTSPEYKDFIVQAGEHAPHYLDGPRPDGMPEEFIQTFALEQKARDCIALRGNVAAEPVE